jgi:photosystem II stability/assembly factor-like uncharacterized protein
MRGDRLRRGSTGARGFVGFSTPATPTLPATGLVIRLEDPSVADEAVVTTWADLIGTAQSPTQATAANKPVWMALERAVRFDPSDSLAWAADTIGDLLNGQAGATVVMVLNNVSIFGTDKFRNQLLESSIGAAGSAIWLNIRADTGEENKVLIGGRSQEADSFQEHTSTATVPAGDSPTIIIGRWDFANDVLRLRLNGTASSASVTFGGSTYTHTTSALAPRLMQNDSGNVDAGSRDLKAFFMYTRAITDAECAVIERYCVAKHAKLGNDKITLLASGGRIDAVCDAGNNVVLAGSRTGVVGHIYRSTDGGITWTDLGGITGGTTEFDDDITAIISGGSGTVYAVAGDSRVFKSTNYGLTWSSLGVVSDGSVAGRALAYSLCVTDAGTLLLADTVDTGGSIWRSTNGGEDWTEVATLSTDGLYRLQKIGSSCIIVNGWDGHIFKSDDDGATWDDKGQLAVSPAFAIEYCGSDIVLVGLDNGKIFRSTDNAENFTEVATPGDGADDFCYLGGNDVVYSTYTGTMKVFISNDTGQNWRDLGVLYAGTLADIADHMILANGHLLIGTVKGYLYRRRTIGNVTI